MVGLHSSFRKLLRSMESLEYLEYGYYEGSDDRWHTHPSNLHDLCEIHCQQLVITRRGFSTESTWILDGLLKLFTTSKQQLALVKVEQYLIESWTEEEKPQAEQAAEAAGIVLAFSSSKYTVFFCPHTPSRTNSPHPGQGRARRVSRRSRELEPTKNGGRRESEDSLCFSKLK
jgi:hypothetical protein